MEDIKREKFESIKKKLLEELDSIEKANYELGRYLKEHVIIDDARMIFIYDGDQFEVDGVS